MIFTCGEGVLSSFSFSIPEGDFRIIKFFRGAKIIRGHLFFAGSFLFFDGDNFVIRFVYNVL